MTGLFSPGWDGVVFFSDGAGREKNLMGARRGKDGCLTADVRAWFNACGHHNVISPMGQPVFFCGVEGPSLVLSISPPPPLSSSLSLTLLSSSKTS